MKEYNKKLGDKLLSEFMGAVVLETYPDHHLMDYGKNPPENERYVSTNCMKYQTSWDWLMPVIRKCKDCKTKYMYDWNDLNSYCNSVMLLDAWYAVVNFVKWYETWKPETN